MEKTLARLVHYRDHAGETHAAVVVHESAAEDRATLFVLPHGEHNNTGATIEYNVVYDRGGEVNHTWHFVDDAPEATVEAELDAEENAEARSAGEDEETLIEAEAAEPETEAATE